MRQRKRSLRRKLRALHVCVAWYLPSVGGRLSLVYIKTQRKGSCSTAFIRAASMSAAYRSGTCQRIEQTTSSRVPPPGHEIVPGDGVEAGATSCRGWVAASRNVVECARVTLADADVIERGIGEPHSGSSVRHGLLIDQCQKTRPAWSGEARAAETGHIAAIDNRRIVEIRFGSHIGRIAQALAAPIRRIDPAFKLLPARNEP